MPQAIRILLVEEEFLVSLDMQDILREAGMTEIDTCRTMAEAAAMHDRLHDYDLAIIEAQFGAPLAVDLADKLLSAGVAVVVTSADGNLGAQFPGASMLEKPFDAAALLAACRIAREGVS